MSVLSAPYFHDADAARVELERTLWPAGPVCPRCAGKERITAVKGGRAGLYRCGPCKRQFTVTVGTVFEASHVPLNLWLQAVFLMCSSKKGISSHQLMRVLDVQYRTAWFMSHRIREAMRSGDLAPFGSGGGIVEVDETFIGTDRSIKPHGDKKVRGVGHKHKVLSLVDRTTGRKQSMVVDSLKTTDVAAILKANIAAEAHIMTDEAPYYRGIGAHFASHEFMRHTSGEYVIRSIPVTHTNTIKGEFSSF